MDNSTRKHRGGLDRERADWEAWERLKADRAEIAREIAGVLDGPAVLTDGKRVVAKGGA